MSLADIGPSPEQAVGGLACAGGFCVLLVAAIVLTVVLYRRSHPKPQSGDRP